MTEITAKAKPADLDCESGGRLDGRSSQKLSNTWNLAPDTCVQNLPDKDGAWKR